MAKIILTPEKISRLKFINKVGLKPGEYEFPDFIVIGPQRTGTGWLHKNLCHHPEIYMPPEKELYFFNKLISKAGENYTSDRIEWYSSKFTPKFSDYLKQNVSNLKNIRSLKSLSLGINKFFMPCLKGEATASYAVMPEELVAEICLLNEDIKAIMLMRHPFDRAWSHAKKDLVRGKKRSFDELEFEEFREFYTLEYQLKCGRYTGIIAKWNRFMFDGNLFVGSYDDLKNDPAGLLRKIYSFLGVADDREKISDFLSQKVINTTGMEEIPEVHRQLLAELFGDEVVRLNRRYGLNWK